MFLGLLVESTVVHTHAQTAIGLGDQDDRTGVGTPARLNKLLIQQNLHLSLPPCSLLWQQPVHRLRHRLSTISVDCMSNTTVRGKPRWHLSKCSCIYLQNKFSLTALSTQAADASDGKLALLSRHALLRDSLTTDTLTRKAWLPCSLTIILKLHACQQSRALLQQGFQRRIIGVALQLAAVPPCMKQDTLVSI